MKITDIEYIKFFQQMIKEEVNKELKKLKYIKAYPAKVINVGAGVADVKIAGDDTLIVNLKNKTGETLLANDNVYLFSPTNNLTNLYIAVKF